jgi:hypothetical protein
MSDASLGDATGGGDLRSQTATVSVRALELAL